MPLQKITPIDRAIQTLRDTRKEIQLQIEELESLRPARKKSGVHNGYTDSNGRTWFFDGRGNKNKKRKGKKI